MSTGNPIADQTVL